jgi:hypothetical protein
MQELLEKFRDADAIFIDLISYCPYIVADILNITTRVDFSPTGAMGLSCSFHQFAARTCAVDYLQIRL